MESVIKSDKIIKNEYNDENGKVIVVSNITIPEMTKEYECVGNLYSEIAENFEKYIKREIVKKSSEKSKNDGFKPYGCVLKYSNTFENEKYLSLIIDSHIFDGVKKSPTVRMPQVWSKSEKRIMCFRDFYSRADRDRLISFFEEEASKRQSEGIGEYKDGFVSLIRSKTDFSRFYLVKEGVAFFYPSGVISDNNYPVVFIDKKDI